MSQFSTLITALGGGNKILGVFSLIDALAKPVQELVVTAEDFFSSIKSSGTAKKSWVMNALKDIVNIFETISTGGQANTWNTIENHMSTTVEVVVSAMNLAKPGMIVDDKGGSSTTVSASGS